MGFWIFNLQLFWIQIEIRLFVFLFGLNDLNFVFANLLESWAGSLSWCLFIKHFVFLGDAARSKRALGDCLSLLVEREEEFLQSIGEMGWWGFAIGFWVRFYCVYSLRLVLRKLT